MAQGTLTNSDVMLSNIMQSSSNTGDKATQAKAKQVRSAFLEYRTQIQETLRTLAENESLDDDRIAEMEKTLTELLITLDKLSKNKVDEKSISSFQGQLNSVGKKLWDMIDDTTDQTPTAQSLRERQSLILEDDRKQDKRFSELAGKIGEPISQFVNANAKLVATVGGGGLKLALGSWLGPAAPLLFTLNDILQVDKAAAKTAKVAYAATKKVVTGITSMTAAAVNRSGVWAASLMTAFKNRWRREDSESAANASANQTFFRRTLNGMRDMGAKLKDIAKSAGGWVMKLLLGLAGILGKTFRQFSGLLKKGLGLMSPIKTVVGAMFKKLASGAASIFSKVKDKLFPATRYDRNGRAMPRRGANGRFQRAGRLSRAGKAIRNSRVGKMVGAAGRFGKGFAGKVMDFGKKIGGLGGGKLMPLAGKALGVAGGAYSLYDDAKSLGSGRYKGKGFFGSAGGGMFDNRATHYGSAIASGAAIGMLGGPVGAAVGAVVGGLVAVVADNKDAIGKFVGSLDFSIKGFSSSISKFVSTLGSWVKGVAGSVATGVKKGASKITQGITKGFTSIKDWALGHTSKTFESGQRGAGTISTGRGDAGGVSYGTYQMSSKRGVAQDFVQTYYPKQFAGLKAGTPAFNAQWKEMAKDPDFEKVQYAYIKDTHYDKQQQALLKKGIDLTTRGQAVRDAVWSTAVQFGGNTQLIAKALSGSKKSVAQMNDREIVEAIQDYKVKNNDQLFAKSDKSVRASTLKRATDERVALGRLLDAGDSKGASALPGTAVAQAVSDSKVVSPATARAQAIPSADAIPSSKPAAKATPPVPEDTKSTTISTGGSGAVASIKPTLSTIPFMPDDNSLLAINIHGVIG